MQLLYKVYVYYVSPYLNITACSLTFAFFMANNEPDTIYTHSPQQRPI